MNDGGGHAAGDEALIKIAGILTDAIREVDVCARYGGDEFALMFPHTPRERATVALQRAQARLRKLRIEWAGAQRGLDISVGIASNEDAGIKSADQLLEAADRALYAAKRERGKIVVASDGILD